MQKNNGNLFRLNIKEFSKLLLGLDSKLVSCPHGQKAEEMSPLQNRGIKEPLF